MKNLMLCSVLLLLAGCEKPTATQIQQQRHSFICKSLIDGYLNAQHLGQFKFWEQQQLNAQQNVEYIYRQPTVHGVMLGILQQPEIRFQCRKEAQQQYVLEVLDTKLNQALPVLTVHLPEQAENQLSAADYSNFSD